MMATRLRKLAVNLGVALLSMLVFFLLSEAALALLKINTRSNLRVVPGKGVTYIPGAFYVHTKEGASRGRFNEHGFRDRPRSWDKPAGTFRIAVLGDSNTEGLQVGLDETFCALLEDDLNARGPGRYEVLNLGHSGFGTADAHMRYVHFGRRYQPDLVILAFFTGNDIRNNSRALNHGALSYYYEQAADGGVSIDTSVHEAYQESLTPVRRVFQAVKRRSYLLSLLSERLYLLRRQNGAGAGPEAGPEAAAGPGNRRQATLPLLSSLNIYIDPPAEAWQEAIDLTASGIELLRDEVSRDGARFAVVTLSNAPQIYPEQQAALEAGVAADLDFDAPERVLARICIDLGIAHLMLLEPLREIHRRTGALLHFGEPPTGHWNQAGHVAAFEAIRDFLIDEGLVPS